ncbi:UNVERIFIED_CONTAM: hypothetical protein K2H54_074994 [Gekko kuhli]
MSFHKENGMGSLCHKALQIISELCLGGQVELEKCSGIFPLETTNQGVQQGEMQQVKPGVEGSETPVPLPLPASKGEMLKSWVL